MISSALPQENVVLSLSNRCLQCFEATDSTSYLTAKTSPRLESRFSASDTISPATALQRNPQVRPATAPSCPTTSFQVRPIPEVTSDRPARKSIYNFEIPKHLSNIHSLLKQSTINIRPQDSTHSKSYLLSTQTQTMDASKTILVCFVVITPICVYGGWKFWKWYMGRSNLQTFLNEEARERTGQKGSQVGLQVQV